MLAAIANIFWFPPFQVSDYQGAGSKRLRDDQPQDKRVRLAAQKHMDRTRDSQQRGRRPPATTSVSTPKGTRTIAALRTPDELHGLVSSPSGKDVLAATMSAKSAALAAVRQDKENLRSILYVWKKEDGEILYVGITQQDPARRILAQEFGSVRRHKGTMAPAFIEALKAAAVSIHLEEIDGDRGELLYRETCMILENRPAGNSSIISEWKDRKVLLDWLAGREDEIAILEQHAEALVQETDCPFTQAKVAKFVNFVRQVKQM